MKFDKIGANLKKKTKKKESILKVMYIQARKTVSSHPKKQYIRREKKKQRITFQVVFFVLVYVYINTRTYVSAETSNGMRFSVGILYET